MKKTIFTFILLPFLCISQNIKCDEFINGKFIMTSEMFPGVEIALERDGNIQIEKQINSINSDDIPKLGIIYEKVEWLSNCKYKLTFDLTRGDVTEVAKVINDNGGIITTITTIENNCYSYESIFIINGKVQKITGKICKDLFN